MPKNLNTNHYFGECMRQQNETFLHETHTPQKPPPPHWIHKTTSKLKALGDIKPIYRFDDGKMSPISSSTINYTSYDTKIKSHKKYRPNETSSHDFTDLVDDCSSNECDKQVTYPSKENKCEQSHVYEQMADYRLPATYNNAQSSSAFRPPFNDGNKRNNAFTATTMPYTAYHFNDTSGYSNYSHDITPTTSAERDKQQFDKAFGKDDDGTANANDSKEYTTLQPAKIGSKADTVIQEVVARDGFAMANTVNNTNDTTMNVTPATMPTAGSVAVGSGSEQRTFYEASTTLAAFSPGSTNKGKTHCL